MWQTVKPGEICDLTGGGTPSKQEASYNERDLADFKALQKTRADSDNSWTASIDDIDKEAWDLTSGNPNVEDTSEKRTPSEILAEIEALDNEATEAMAAIKELL